VFIVVVYFVIDSVRKLLDTTSYTHVRIEVFKAINFQVMDFWVMTQCSDVIGCHCFEGPCCSHLQREV